jgi:hypothetical protein
MRWVISFLVFVAGMAGAVFFYMWAGQIAVPAAIAASTLVFTCMVLTVGGDSDPTSQGSRTESARQSFNPPPQSSWPDRDGTPDSQAYRRR